MCLAEIASLDSRAADVEYKNSDPLLPKVGVPHDNQLCFEHPGVPKRKVKVADEPTEIQHSGQWPQPAEEGGTKGPLTEAG